MGERAKIMLNEYTAKALLKRDDLDLDKFYSTDIKTMVKVAQQELKKKDNIINELEEYIKPYLYMLNGIQDRDIYEQCQLDDFTDIMEKLQALKENNK